MSDLDPTVGEILHLAHHAAGDPSLWDEVMRRLCARFKVSRIALIDHNFITRQGDITHAAGIDEQFRTLYRARFSEKNVWLNTERRLAPGEVFTGAELVPNWELVRTEFYRDWLRPLHAFHCLIGITFGSAEEIGSLVALRSLDERGFDAQDKRDLASLLLQLRCACELGAEFTAARRTVDILSDIMQSMSEAILIVDGQCHPVFLNRAAERVLAEDDHLTLAHGMLAAASGLETGKLRQLVAAAAGCSGNGLTGSDSAIAVTCRSGAPPMLLRIRSIPHSAIYKGGREKHVVAVFTGTTEMTESVRQLYDLYHLTPAEARLAALILRGYSLHAAARRLHVSNNTARTHMKRIYDKTETHRQVDLIRLVAGGAMPRH
jgi:DNA-binding CsgD family transcriptional regulator/PAS domain-containing protein